VEIQPTWFFEKIAIGCDKQACYISESSFRYHRHLGHSLTTGIYDQVGTLVNFRRNHWVPIVIDFRKREILYGDSLGAPVPLRVKLVLTWWTEFHSGNLFTYRNLNITLQNDSFSCGLLSYNALLVHFMESEALIAAADVAKGHLCILQKIMNEHQSCLSVSW
jgi:Ulp1 protease family, C-terminal catalytic domain